MVPRAGFLYFSLAGRVWSEATCGSGPESVVDAAGSWPEPCLLTALCFGSKQAAKPKSDKPPRAPSAYNLYVKDKSAELRATGKHANQQDLMRELGVMWKGLSEHDRQQYTQRAQLGGEAAEAGAGPAAADSDDDDTSKKRKAVSPPPPPPTPPNLKSSRTVRYPSRLILPPFSPRSCSLFRSLALHARAACTANGNRVHAQHGGGPAIAVLAALSVIDGHACNQDDSDDEKKEKKKKKKDKKKKKKESSSSSDSD